MGNATGNASREPRTRSALCLLAGVVVFAATTPLSAVTVREVSKKMGSRFEVTAVHESEETARRAVAAAWAEVDRIEALISSWQETSETSAVNRAAGGEPVEVSQELFRLLRRSLKISELTGGAFDVTFAGAGQVLMVSVDDELAGRDRLVRELSLRLPVLWDESYVIAEHYQPAAMPATFVLDPAGKLVHQHVGSDRRSWSELVGFIEQVSRPNPPG